MCLLASHCETKLLHPRTGQFNLAPTLQGSVCFVWTNLYNSGFSCRTLSLSWGTVRIPLPHLHDAVLIARSSLKACILLIKSHMWSVALLHFYPYLSSQSLHASSKPSLCESDQSTHSLTWTSCLVRKRAEELVHICVSVPSRTFQRVSLHSYIGTLAAENQGLPAKKRD